MVIVCHRFVVKGYVQGVWFRKHTKQQVNKLRIKGVRKNHTKVCGIGFHSDVIDYARWQPVWQHV